MYRGGSYYTCNNLYYGKILNIFKLCLLVTVLLMVINEHQRSKERRHSHDTKALVVRDKSGFIHVTFDCYQLFGC